MTELMTAIALMCQVHAHDGSLAIDRQQAACQAFFAKCVAEMPIKSLGQCAIERNATLR